MSMERIHTYRLAHMQKVQGSIPSQEFPVWTRLFLHIQLHCCVSPLPVRVFMVVCSSISALWWIRHSSVDDSTSHHFNLGPCRHWLVWLHLLLINADFPPTPPPPGAGVWDGEEYCHVSCSSRQMRGWAWKALLGHLILDSKGDSDAAFPPKGQNITATAQ